MGPLLDLIEGRMAAMLAGTAVLLLLVGATLYTRQANVWVAAAESQANLMATRAATAETRAAVAEGQLTAVANQQLAQQTAVAAASATAIAQATAVFVAQDPRSSLEKALNLVFAAYKEPTQPRVRALDDVIGPDAFSVFRPELDRLQTVGGKLGGESSFKVQVLDVNNTSPEQAEVRTTEEWRYDERDRADKQLRCLVESSEQTYVMQRDQRGWIVQQVLPGATRRAPC